MQIQKLDGPYLKQAVTEPVLQWLLAMQSSDGGWAAFDVDNNWEFLSYVPFADHNAMLDPTCPDITGRVLEALAVRGLNRTHPALRRGRDYLVKEQQADGSWYGRWGVAYIYGTCFALRGLAAIEESSREAHMLRATEWLRSIQNADGGWGESCASYDQGFYAPGPSTPSQTAWAVMGLIAGGDTHSESVLNATRGRGLGPGAVYGHRVSQGVLPELPHVPAVFSDHRPGGVRENAGCRTGEILSHSCTLMNLCFRVVVLCST